MLRNTRKKQQKKRLMQLMYDKLIAQNKRPGWVMKEIARLFNYKETTSIYRVITKN